MYIFTIKHLIIGVPDFDPCPYEILDISWFWIYLDMSGYILRYIMRYLDMAHLNGWFWILNVIGEIWKHPPRSLESVPCISSCVPLVAPRHEHQVGKPVIHSTPLHRSVAKWSKEIPFGKLTDVWTMENADYGAWTINHPFSGAMLVYQRLPGIHQMDSGYHRISQPFREKDHEPSTCELCSIIFGQPWHTDIYPNLDSLIILRIIQVVEHTTFPKHTLVCPKIGIDRLFHIPCGRFIYSNL